VHREDDADDVRTHCQDPEMARWTRIPQPYRHHHALEFIRSREPAWYQGHSFTYAVVAPDPDTGDDRYAGAVELFGIGGPPTAEVGYGLASWARGRGIGSTAVRLLLTWGFDTLGLDVVHWRAGVGNWPSRRLAWAVGFRIEGTVRGLLDQRGTATDAWIGSLHRDDPREPVHPWFDPPRIVTPEVVLRRYRAEDEARAVDALNDPAIRHWFPELVLPWTPAEQRRHRAGVLTATAEGRQVSWAVADPRDDRLVGEVTLFGLDRGGTTAEVGFWTHPDARGRGVARAAVRAAVRHGVLPIGAGGLGLERLVCRAAVDNHASLGVVRAAWFRETGRERRAERCRDGTRRDLLRWDLLAEEIPPGD
jgi:RimJ/RimL family protein N-acetyltransferase